jgi:hypothetical protein
MLLLLGMFLDVYDDYNALMNTGQEDGVTAVSLGVSGKSNATADSYDRFEKDENSSVGIEVPGVTVVGSGVNEMLHSLSVDSSGKCENNSGKCENNSDNLGMFIKYLY